MNLIDVILILLLAWGLWSGLREGLVVQLGAIAGILIGIWLAFRWGLHVGLLLGLDGTTASVGGFIAVLLAAVLLIAILSRLLRSFFRLTGLGIFDSLLGAVAGALKVALVAALLVAAFDSLNADHTLLPREQVERSRLYAPLRNLADRFFPYFGDVKRQLLDRLDSESQSTAP